MSKGQFTRTFHSLDEFAAGFGQAYVEAATPPAEAVERIHQASQRKGVKAKEEEALARKRVDALIEGLKPQKPKPKRRNRAGVHNKRVTKVM